MFSRGGMDENLHERMTKRMVQTTAKEHQSHAGTVETRRKRGHKRGCFAEQLVVELTMEALERREWPRTEAEIHLLRSAMFAAQAIIRDMERDGREAEIEQISRNISEIAPELPGGPAIDPRDRVDSESGNT